MTENNLPQTDVFENVVFLTSVLPLVDDSNFFVAFAADLTIGPTPHGFGLILSYTGGQGEDTQKIFPSHTIKSWDIVKTISDHGNYRGTRLRIVVPLPPLPGYSEDNDWLLTFKIAGWNDYRRMKLACRKSSFAGSGHRLF
jgi:hypothetical protein